MAWAALTGSLTSSIDKPVLFQTLLSYCSVE